MANGGDADDDADDDGIELNPDENFGRTRLSVGTKQT
jgi:hypothetical protein